MKVLGVLGAAFAVLLVVPLLAIGIAFGGQLGEVTSQEPPSATATKALPAVLIAAEEVASEQCVGLPWQVLAAVNLTVDPDLVAHLDTTTGNVSPPVYGPAQADPGNPGHTIRTLGPMGFMPATWTAYEELYDGAPVGSVPDPQNDYDATFTLANALCALQVNAGDVLDTLLAYDALPTWADSVMTLAISYGMNVDGTTTDVGGSTSTGTPTGGSPPPAGSSSYAVAFPPGPVFSGTGTALVAAAETQLGVPYVWGGITPGVGLDCSGLVVVSMQALGFDLLWNYRTSQEQATLGTTVALSALQPGDLLFFEGEDVTGPSFLGHVGIYVGNGLMINAPETGEVVQFAAVPWGAVEIARRVLTSSS